MTIVMDNSVLRKHPHAKCEECPLFQSGKFVPSSFPGKDIELDDGGVANYSRRIAVIGESPGRQEVNKGAVFIGPSGKVLDAVLVEHGIDRQRALMGNAIACHYPESLFDKPPKDAVVACRSKLLSELQAANIDTVITVGAVAATSLIDTKIGITKLRAGGPRPASYLRLDGRELEVIPTFHPAAALRDQSKFPYIVQDIAKIKPGGVWGTWKDPNFVVVDNIAIATKYINWLDSSKYFGPIEVDTESGAEKDETFGGGINEVLCIGVWYEDLGKVAVFTPAALNEFNRRLLGKIFMSRGIVAQNGKYDTTRCLNAYLGEEGKPLDIPVRFDTMLAHYCMDEGKGVHGLKYMMTEYLGAPDYEKWLTESMEEGRRRVRAARKAAKLPLKGFATGKDFSLVDPDVLHKYNAFDVYGTRLLRERFEPQLVEGQVDGLNKWLLKINGMLAHVETNGIAVDLDYNAELEVRYKQLLADIEFKGAEDINPNSWQQVQKYLKSIGIKVDSTNKPTIQGLIEKYQVLGRDDVVDFCQSLLDHRGASKLMGTYVTGLRKNLVDGVVHPSFLLHGTTTGRLSCRNPNVQNIPRKSDMKAQFVPSRKGRIFIQCDQSQSELRVMTWLGKDVLMKQLFDDPTRDVFVELSRSVYGASVFDGYSDYVRNEKRTLIKTFAYGISYGREAKAIALAFGIPIVEAQRQMKMFKGMIPGIIGYMQDLKQRVMAGEDLVTPFGRRRRFHLITDANVISVMNEAMAFMPQAISSDICLEAAYRLDEAGLELRNLVHDSILAECDIGDAEEVARLMKKTMIEVGEEVIEGYTKFAVDVEVGYNLRDLVKVKNWDDLRQVA